MTGYKVYVVSLHRLEKTFEVFAAGLDHAERIAFSVEKRKIASIVQRDVPPNGKRDFIMYDVVNERENVSRKEYLRRGKFLEALVRSIENDVGLQNVIDEAVEDDKRQEEFNSTW